MPASTHATPISRRDDALAIVRRLAAAGHVAYFAGGCVRDMLLGLESKDFDVATDAPPDVVRKLFPRSQGVGQAFGVVLVREGKSQIEVATFRADGSYTDGRRPDSVRFATPEEDARRRDFTINGLFFDPLADRVIDTVDGIADLNARVLRAIGDPTDRFAEDYLRILRAIRFAARFDLKIDPPTEAAIRANIDRLPRIAPERITDELRTMLAAPSRKCAVDRIFDLGLTPILFRKIVHDSPNSGPLSLLAAIVGGDQPPSFALALAAWSIDALEASQSIDDILEIGNEKPRIRALRQTFRLSNDQCAALDAIFATVWLTSEGPPTIAKLKRFAAGAFAADAMRFLRALAAANVYRERIAAIDAMLKTFEGTDVAPPPFITGDDLQKAGYAPGPKFKLALDAAYDAQLEDAVRIPSEALAVAERVLKS